jgi:hypothetical protein
MDPLLRRSIGHTSLEVTQLGMVGRALGDMREHPRGAGDRRHRGCARGRHRLLRHLALVRQRQERAALRPRPAHQAARTASLSTKVGRAHKRPAEPDTYRHPGWAGGLPFEPRFDYTHDGVLRSYEMSLARLGLNRVEALLIHDLDPRHHGSLEGVVAGLAQLDNGGGYRALADLKAQGEIAAIGAGSPYRHPALLERWPIDSSSCRPHAARSGSAGELTCARARRLGRQPYASHLVRTQPALSTTIVPPEIIDKASASPLSAGVTTCRLPPPPCSSLSGTEGR